MFSDYIMNNSNSFIETAKQGDSRVGIYVVVFILVLLANMLGSLPGAWVMIQRQESPDQFPVYIVMALMLLGFLVSLIVLWLAVKHIHKRNPQTLISSVTINWNRIIKSGLLWLFCTAVVEYLTYVQFPEKYKFSFDAAVFFPALIVGLLLIPFQAGFEEVFFRGYLMTRIGAWNVWAGLIISATLFGLAHSFNDEIEAAGSLEVAMIYYIGVGLLFGWLALKDKSLELPIGMHVANNLYAFSVVGYPSSSLPSATIWMTTELNFPLMLVQWFITVVLYLVLMKKVVGFDWNNNGLTQ